MVREDLVASAVSFLQDPSVATSPVEKRIAFLQSKNLTQEEIDTALSRAEDSSPPSSSSSSSVSVATPPSSSGSSHHGYGYQKSQPVRQPTYPSNGGFGQYPPGWTAPPEPPHRDWRDWFIMATVTGGVSYGLYTLTKRYIVPLIAPPTPPQLEQDKNAIDEQFNRAFTLLDQLSTDTSALKSAEEARTERLDSALSELETAVRDLKASNQIREDENRRIEAEVRSLRDGLKHALDGVREKGERRLGELGSEMKSLKVLVGNRMAGSTNTSSSINTPAPSTANTMATAPSAATGVPGLQNGLNKSPLPTPGAGIHTPSFTSANVTGDNAGRAASPATIGTRSTPTPFGAAAGRPAIPAWQMAAANKADEEKKEEMPMAAASAS
ncbi:MAG: peroxisomal membrane protein pex14 [Cirrosporium novae-zelandiae]|nr:MAG: peroxisomal membrane protein pex14 [Cirrosporium novae-zelandiae]